MTRKPRVLYMNAANANTQAPECRRVSEQLRQGIHPPPTIAEAVAAHSELDRRLLSEPWGARALPEQP